ncbi:MAG TPA: hypothetical protein VFP65_01100 [Anaeromyxobacteraceae bacterium]|nr:hypothetical protein [Anaeromyxobacteraceae bacterium]
MSRWMAAFGRRKPNVEVIYQSLGSGQRAVVTRRCHGAKRSVVENNRDSHR